MLETEQTNKYDRGVRNEHDATTWEEAMVSGNGKQGVMVFGQPRNETLIGNHARLYLPLGKRPDIPNMASYLDELRDIIKEQGYGAAKTFYFEKARELGYQGLTMSNPSHPGFHLHIHTNVNHYNEYERWTNFTTGEITVHFVDEYDIHHQRKTFVSRPDDVIVHEITNSDHAVSCTLSLEKYDHPLLKQTFDLQANMLCIHNRYVHGDGGYRVCIQVETRSGDVHLNGHELIIQEAEKVLLLMHIEPFKTSSEAFDPPYIKHDKPNYHALLNRHQHIHADMFQRVQLTLAHPDDRLRTVEDLMTEAKQTDMIPPALVEKLYDAGRYMFICSAGELSPNLQGLWTGTFEPAWSGDFTFDTNVQLSIASALSSRLFEGMHGFFRMIDEFMPAFRQNASLYYGCRGIMSAAHASDSGLHFHWNEDWPLHFWTCGAGWLGHWFYQYYLHTGDKGFLKEQTIPYLKECALFYEDFLTTDTDGTYRFTPSYSAENGCADNATQDIAVAKEVLQNLIAAHEALQIDTPDIVKWQRMLRQLPDYLCNDDGILQEWAVEGKEENYNHRHFSHLYPIFQSRELTPAGTPDLWAASKRAFDKRLEAWLRSPEADTSSTHGRMHAALCATQFGDRDLVYEIFQMMIKKDAMYSTLMTSHYNHQNVFNVDGNGAIPQIIHELLIDGAKGNIKVLQAIPRQLSTGKISGVSLPQHVLVKTLTWNLEAQRAQLVICSQIDQKVTITAPLFSDVQVQMSGECAPSTKNAPYTIALTAHHDITIDLYFSS